MPATRHITAGLLALLAVTAIGAPSPHDSNGKRAGISSAKVNPLFRRQDGTMCGPNSEDGKCGMKLCCSGSGWCGATADYCGAGCQSAYGSCAITAPPSCSATGSTKGRTVGYYQSWNSRDKACDKVLPSQIDTAGLTHLYFSFASIDPVSFAITPANSADVALMNDFKKLKRPGLQTWIAVGGGEFSDVGKTTHTTWSDMVSTAASRAKFIASLKPFMTTYGFQGVDLDWEYPVAAARGGKKADTANYVALVKELRAAFGTAYGISLVLPPDYGYLRYFDAKAMEPYVDWFGFMAYDLHGPWDTTTIIRGQADIREISTSLLPLWFDGVNPSKVNFGVAYYGRGYTVPDPKCASIGCQFSGPSKPAKCTNNAGFMSLSDIQTLIKEKGLVPEYLADPMMKQITFDDQWIGYDDLETIAKKKEWADKKCFGGTMIWAIDFAKPATATTNGQCGTGVLCGNWAGGSCCSAAGWCGATSAYCGAGCQSGACTAVGNQTPDGQCGATHGNTVCGSWPEGGCCSPAGWCGNTDAHCGAGCQSGPCK